MQSCLKTAGCLHSSCFAFNCNKTEAKKCKFEHQNNVLPQKHEKINESPPKKKLIENYFHNKLYAKEITKIILPVSIINSLYKVRQS